MKSGGKRAAFLRTASFSRPVGTPYSAARSLSSITFSPRIIRIRRSTRSTSAAERAFARLVMGRLACFGTVNRGSTSMPFPALALFACVAVIQGDGRWSAAARRVRRGSREREARGGGRLGRGTEAGRFDGDLRSRHEPLEKRRADPHAPRSPHRGRSARHPVRDRWAAARSRSEL